MSETTEKKDMFDQLPPIELEHKGLPFKVKVLDKSQLESPYQFPLFNSSPSWKITFDNGEEGEIYMWSKIVLRMRSEICYEVDPSFLFDVLEEAHKMHMIKKNFNG